MNWSIALPFAAGAAAAMLVVGRFAHRFTGPGIQQGFAILAAAVAIGIIIRQVRNLL
jgi:uncharacterized membrane protein YfcA